LPLPLGNGTVPDKDMGFSPTESHPLAKANGNQNTDGILFKPI
jgi:hypothetical protein